MKNRISSVVEKSGLTKTAFAKKINVSQGLVSQICSGTTTPSDRTISDICRIFSVREEWLRDGTGEMYMPKPEDDDEYINALLADQDDPVYAIIKATLKTYLDLSPEDQKALREFAAQVSRKLKEGRD